MDTGKTGNGIVRVTQMLGSIFTDKEKSRLDPGIFPLRIIKIKTKELIIKKKSFWNDFFLIINEIKGKIG